MAITILLLLASVPCWCPALALIRPRFDQSQTRWWETSQSETRTTPLSQSSRTRYNVFDLVGPKESRARPFPAYTFTTNSAGPKPPPGYHFSAGPKPTRYPSTPRQSGTQERAVSGPEPPKSAAHSLPYDLWREASAPNKGQKEHKKTGARPGSPSVCGAACPSYEVLSRHARHEVRRYPTTAWLSYVTTTENRPLAEMEASAGIEGYLDGNNQLGLHLPATYPSVTQMRLSAPLRSQQAAEDFTVSVPLLGDNVHPRPRINQLVLDEVGPQTVYVTSFWARPWKLTDRTLRMRTRRLSRRLRRRGDTYLRDFFYLAKYEETDSHHRAFYEIWLYSTPHKSKHRFRPMGKPVLPRLSGLTNETRLRLCRGYECPRFEVLAGYPGGIQKRHYYNAAFATSKMKGCDTGEEAIWRSLIPLHLYRQGVNSHLEVIEFTRPAGVLRVWEGGNSSCQATAMVYLPRRLHRSPPNTGDTAPPIGLSYIHELTVYVQTVGGAELAALPEQLSSFQRRLDTLSLCYRTQEYFVAVYDPAPRYHGRVNELWMVAQRCSGTAKLV